MLPASMVGTFVSAALICAAAPLVGQAVLRVGGYRDWSWLSAAVGMSALMLLAVPALHVPGRAVTTAVVLAIVTVGCAVAAVRDPAMRMPSVGLLTAAPVGALALVPFASAGQAGTLGISFNNDTASHLIWAEAYRSDDIARINPVEDSYPLGPHALVAALGEGLGIPTEEALAGLTIACPVLLAWTAMGALRSMSRPTQVLAGVLAGMPFLVAGYYGQGSFKELQQAILVLALVVALMGQRELGGRLRWLPVALVVAGVLSVYSFPGLAWPVAIGGVWLAGLAAERYARRRSLREAVRLPRGEAVPIALGAGALLILLVPQGPRLIRFFSDNFGTNATGIETTDVGNLAGRLPVWEAFGVWDNNDYRFPNIDPFAAGMWTAFVLGLVLAGAVWWWRRGDWLLPAATAASLLIWAVSDRTQSPYVAAKALVILSPLLMLLAAAPPIESAVRARWPVWWRLAAAAVAVALALQVVSSSWGALRTSRVGPRAHLEELRDLRPLLDGGRTLFLGVDDYIRWELAGEAVDAPFIGFQGMDTRPEKPWEYGQPFDFDSLDAAVLNEYDWIIAPRDAAGSAPPEQLRLEEVTQSFGLWRREGEIEQRSLLPEGPVGAAWLKCGTARGREVLADARLAAVREPGASLEVGPVEAGSVRVVELPLAPGEWELQLHYDSQHPIDVAAPGLQVELPAHLDRPGPRWRVGRIEVDEPGPVTIRLDVEDTRFTPPGRLATIGSLVATPVAPPRLVPVREACGKLVDWYES
jgi:uncharacterized membrane protein (UPF0136 family)